MRVTQQDIAQLAGVSQATVSRVLSGDDRVDTDIRERVYGVIQAQNYKPDVRARSLRQQKTNLIGLVMHRGSGSLKGDPFFALVVSEIVETLAGTPWHLCVEIATDEKKQKHIYDELLRTRRVDGLILVESQPRDERILSLQEDQFPFVVIGNASDHPALHAIDNNNIHAGQIATEHLKKSGYKHIAFLGGPENLTVTQDRRAGYREMVSNPIEAYSEFGAHAAKEVARQLLCGKQAPDAIVAMDDFLAMGVVQAARELGLELGKDLGIVGFNNSELCTVVEGGLTSVDLQIADMVRWSIRRLVAVIDGDDISDARQHTMGCELKVRGSSVKATGATII